MAPALNRERIRFFIDNKVELRSEDEGFLGSWHSGALIETELLDSNIRYVIRYDHMLADDESDHCIESLMVNQNEVCEIRGRIRPIPPPLKIREWDLFYGLCVDVHYNDAWWEGVVFDHEDGSETRCVVFPDLGDEMMIRISEMRITQDWNNVNGTWKMRGTWLFLELLEEFENGASFDLSPIQLWFDLRQKEQFQKLGEWTSGDKKLWKVLVRETLDDNLKLLINLSNGTCLRKLQQSAESDSLVDINMQKHQSDASVGDKEICLLPLDSSLILQKQNEKPVVCSSAEEEEFSSSGGKNLNGKSKCRKHTWLPAGPNIVSGAEFCPDAVVQYLQRTKKSGPSLFFDIRKHLLHLGWKVEYSKEESFRLRYTSPDGKLYYSLRQVCLSLNELHTENVSSITQDENGSLSSSADPSPLPSSEELTVNHVTAYACHSDVVFVKPEFCLEAAANWCRYDKPQHTSIKRARMSLRARMHLSAVGWKFRWAILCRGNRELRYISPEGKVYNSLRKACGDAIRSCASACIHQEGKSVSKVNVKAACQKDPSSLRIKFKIPFPLQKSKVGGNQYVHRKRKVSLLSSSLHKQDDISDAQYSFSKLNKIRKTRGLIKLQNNKMGGTRNKIIHRKRKKVKQIATPNHQKPLTVLSWLINNNIVLPRTKVNFCSKRGSCSTAGGRITRDGIKCNCCKEVYTLSGFTFHVGGNQHSPAATIFLKDGRSLLQCQNEFLEKEMQNFVEEPPRNSKNGLKRENDNICSVCQYGGELLLCDQCPSSFHKGCLDLLDVPDGDWFCPSCCCKICGHNKLERDSECSTSDDAVLNCTQCEQKYHIWCIRNRGKTCLKRIRRGNWFCSKRCKEIFSGLSGFLGKPIPVGSSNLTWTLLKPNYLAGAKPHTPSYKDWIENCSKLSIAVEIMHECFENVEDPYTKRDLLKDVIFNKESKLRRLNFGGFYTVILQKDDEFVSAATVRVYGEKVAELPLVGTRFQYRRLGMCRILMNILEKKLVELGVQRLVLPAVPSVLNTWIGSFGFSKLAVPERLQLVDYTFLDFQGTVMCYKQLMKIPSAKSCPSKEIPPQLHNITTANCNNMGLEGSCAASDVSEEVQIQAGTSEQCQAEYVVDASNSNSSVEEPIEPTITLKSESEPRPGEISMDCSVDESSRKRQLGENKSSNGSNMEIRHKFGGLKVYTRRSKAAISGELKFYKRRKLVCK